MHSLKIKALKEKRTESISRKIKLKEKEISKKVEQIKHGKISFIEKDSPMKRLIHHGACLGCVTNQIVCDKCRWKKHGLRDDLRIDREAEVYLNGGQILHGKYFKYLYHK